MNLIIDESILKDLLSGLVTTLAISVISLIIGAGLSVLINRGLQLRNTFAKGIIIVVTQIIRGIPLLIQLFIFYYALPLVLPILLFNSKTTAVIVLAINAAVNISANIDMYHDLIKSKLSKLQSMRLNLFYVLRELGETIKNSTLISILGIMELYRVASKIEVEKGFPYGFLIAAIIYIVIYFIIYFVCKNLKKNFMLNEGNVENR